MIWRSISRKIKPACLFMPQFVKSSCVIKNSSKRTKDMKMMFSASAVIMFMLLTLLLMMGSSHDTIFHPGDLCSESDNSTVYTSYQANLNTLLSSLSTNVPSNNGFYKSRVGKDSDWIYGIGQCRGDISSSDCANCTSKAIRISLRACPNSRDVTIWFNWCMLRYSNESMFGVWEKTSMETPTGNATDDPVMSSKGLSMMSVLVSTTPNQPGMVQSSVIDVGHGRKRYGMAQCRRDISQSDCGKCLDDLLETYQSQIANQTGWDIYGLSCSMWYNGFKFYSNISIHGTPEVETPSHGGSYGSKHRFDVINISITALVFMLVYLSI